MGKKKFPKGEEVKPVTNEELRIQEIENEKKHLHLPESVLKNGILYVNSLESLIQASEVLGLPYNCATSSLSSSSSSSSSLNLKIAKEEQIMKSVSKTMKGKIKKNKLQ